MSVWIEPDFSRRGRRRWRHKSRTHGKRYLHMNGRFCGVTWVKKKTYACCRCGALGVKLWRPYQTSCVELHCARCACADQKKPYEEMDAAGTLPDKIDGYHRTDQIGWFVPAVPDDRPDARGRFAGMYWGYLSVPDDDITWWRALPLEVKAT